MEGTSDIQVPVIAMALLAVGRFTVGGLVGLEGAAAATVSLDCCIFAPGTKFVFLRFKSDFFAISSFLFCADLSLILSRGADPRGVEASNLDGLSLDTSCRPSSAFSKVSNPSS